jgi:hypothetical protein
MHNGVEKAASMSGLLGKARLQRRGTRNIIKILLKLLATCNAFSGSTFRRIAIELI